MKSIFIFLILFNFGFSFSQSTLDFHIASISGKFNYTDLDAFADSYNTFYVNDPTLLTPIKMKTFATGLQIGTTLNFREWINGSVDIANVRTAVSRAEWNLGFDRCFQLKSFLFDMDFGFYVIPETSSFRISVGLGLTLQSTQIESFLEYNKIRSYGGETGLNGVWSSWKGYTPLVVKLSYLSTNEHWKIFINGKFPIQKNKLNSTGYAYSSGFTNVEQVFPADFGGSWLLDNRLSENFRFINVALGIAFQFSVN